MAKNMIKIEAIFGACRERERDERSGENIEGFCPWFPHQIHNDAALYKTQHPLSIQHTLKSGAGYSGKSSKLRTSYSTEQSYTTYAHCTAPTAYNIKE